VTSLLFLATLAGRWALRWYAYLDEQKAHHAEPVVSEFPNQISRHTLENWQSKFLHPVWQVSGLALLFRIGSPNPKKVITARRRKRCHFAPA
jgi:hypothetical protein